MVLLVVVVLVVSNGSDVMSGGGWTFFWRQPTLFWRFSDATKNSDFFLASTFFWRRWTFYWCGDFNFAWCFFGVCRVMAPPMGRVSASWQIACVCWCRIRAVWVEWCWCGGVGRVFLRPLTFFRSPKVFFRPLI